MGDYHEPEQELAPADRDIHRALMSFKEEIEAIDWYHERVVLCADDGLRAVLAHNRDEEIEHACLTLEWLRRHMPGWQDNLATHVFTDAPIAQREQEQPGQPDHVRHSNGLGIGSLKEEGKKENGRWIS